MCNISCKLDFFLCLLLILLVSILLSHSNRFVCCFRLLKFTLRKSRLNTVYTSDSIQQERLSISLEVGRIYFNLQTYICKDICCKRSKSKIPSDYILTSSRLYAKEFSFDKSPSVKYAIYQKLYNSNINTFSFLMYVIFHITPGLLLPQVGI